MQTGKFAYFPCSVHHFGKSLSRPQFPYLENEDNGYQLANLRGC